MTGRKSVHVRIEGKVQRVWYRNWTVREATGLGVTGWVRNRLDETVEAVFSGPEEAVDRLLKACWDGPPRARVTAVTAVPCDPPANPGFEQFPTE